MARNLFFVSKEDVLRTPWHHTGLGPLYACFVVPASVACKEMEYS
jgi:hypothetical protein